MLTRMVRTGDKLKWLNRDLIYTVNNVKECSLEERTSCEQLLCPGKLDLTWPNCDEILAGECPNYCFGKNSAHIFEKVFTIVEETRKPNLKNINLRFVGRKG